MSSINQEQLQFWHIDCSGAALDLYRRRIEFSSSFQRTFFFNKIKIIYVSRYFHFRKGEGNGAEGACSGGCPAGAGGWGG